MTTIEVLKSSVNEETSIEVTMFKNLSEKWKEFTGVKITDLDCGEIVVLKYFPIGMTVSSEIYYNMLVKNNL